MGNRRGNSTCFNRLFTPLFLFFSINSFATPYFVSSTGNDANPGTTPATAWATIGKVNSTVFLPGDELYFEGGKTFNGNISLQSTDANDPDNIFIISSYGTGRATINAGTSFGFSAHNTQGFSISNLNFDGNSTSTNAGEGILIFSDLPGNIKFSNISLTDIEIKNFGEEGVKIYTTQGLTGFQNVTLNNLSVHDVMKNGIIVYGFIAQSLVGWQHKNVSVSNCEVYDVPGSSTAANYEGSGIVLEGVDGGVIQHCVAHDNGDNNVFCGGPVGIWTFESNNVTIQYNESYHNHSGSGCDGGGFDLDGGVTNSFLQYNYSHENDGAGYLLGQYDHARPWSNNTVRYNISQNDGITNEGAINLFKGPATSMSDAYIYNNVIYVSPQAASGEESAVFFKNWTTGINNVYLYNNIFITTGGVPLVNIPSGYSAFFAGNIYWPSGGAFSIFYQGSLYSSLSSWRTATGNEKVNSVNTGLNSNPLLTNVGAGGTIGFGVSLSSLNAYKMSNILSPPFQAALDLNSLFSIDAGAIDFWGTPLPGGNSNDIGANQFSSILPIRLLGFHGSCSGSEQVLSWSTAEESNVKSIELMYSGDETAFASLVSIPPKGSYSQYNYTNEKVSSGTNYYQLKMTDLDGSVTYSSILSIQCSKTTNKIMAGPNPFDQYLNVSIESLNPGPVTLFLLDVLGNIISQKEVQVRQGNNVFRFDGMDHLSSGTYYLRVVQPENSSNIRLIKAGQ